LRRDLAIEAQPQTVVEISEIAVDLRPHQSVHSAKRGRVVGDDTFLRQISEPRGIGIEHGHDDPIGRTAIRRPKRPDGEAVRPRAAIDLVVARIAVDGVVPFVSGKAVILISTREAVAAETTRDGVLSSIAEERVVTHR